MNPSSAPRESPNAVGGVVTPAAADGAGGGPPNTSISRPRSEGPGAAASGAGERERNMVRFGECRYLLIRYKVYNVVYLHEVVTRVSPTG